MASGAGAFVAGALLGGVEALDERIDKDVDARRQMTLEEWRLQKQREYAQLARKDALDFESSPEFVEHEDQKFINQTNREIRAMPLLNAAEQGILDENSLREYQRGLTIAQKKEDDLMRQFTKFEGLLSDSGVPVTSETRMQIWEGLTGFDLDNSKDRASGKAFTGTALKIAVDTVQPLHADALSGAVYEAIKDMPNDDLAQEIEDEYIQYVSATRAGNADTALVALSNLMEKSAKADAADFPKGQRLVEWLDASAREMNLASLHMTHQGPAPVEVLEGGKARAQEFIRNADSVTAFIDTDVLRGRRPQQLPSVQQAPPPAEEPAQAAPPAADDDSALVRPKAGTVDAIATATQDIVAELSTIAAENPTPEELKAVLTGLLRERQDSMSFEQLMQVEQEVLALLQSRANVEGA